MRIRVLAFATARDALGTRALEVDLPEGSRLTELKSHLEATKPEIGAIWGRLAIAIDGTLATPESTLHENAEVALLPPVSGGCGPTIALIDGPLETERLLEAVSHPSCGAALLFEGRVRNSRGEREVTHLEYEGYKPMASSALERILNDLEARTTGLRLGIIHRLGAVPVGEISVAIAAAAPHRAAAFEACRQALERLKREVPIWKEEHYADGTAEWREEEALATHEEPSPS